MNKTNKISRKYIRQVKKHLKCSSKKRKEFLDTLITEIHNFEIENPNAEYADYVKVFGSPKSAAEEYMKELSENEQLTYWSLRIGLLIAALIVLFLLLLAYFIANNNTKSPRVGYQSDSVISSSYVVNYDA